MGKGGDARKRKAEKPSDEQKPSKKPKSFNIDLIEGFSVYKHKEFFTKTRHMAVFMLILETHLRYKDDFLGDTEIVRILQRWFNEIINAKKSTVMQFLLDTATLEYRNKKYHLTNDFEERIKTLFFKKLTHGNMKTVFGKPEDKNEYNIEYRYAQLKECVNNPNYLPIEPEEISNNNSSLFVYKNVISIESILEQKDPVTTGTDVQALESSLLLDIQPEDFNWAPTYQPTVIKKAEPSAIIGLTSVSNSNKNDWKSIYALAQQLNITNLELSPKSQIPATASSSELPIESGINSKVFNAEQVTNFSIYKNRSHFTKTRSMAILMLIMEAHLNGVRFLCDHDILNGMEKFDEILSLNSLKYEKSRVMPYLLSKGFLKYDENTGYYFLSDNFEEQIKELVLMEKISLKMITKFGERGDQVTYDVGKMYEELKNSLTDANWAPAYQPTVIKKAEQPVKAKGTKKSTELTGASNNNNNQNKFDVKQVTNFSVYKNRSYFTKTRAMAISMLIMEAHLHGVRFLCGQDILDGMQKFDEILSFNSLNHRETSVMSYLLSKGFLKHDENTKYYFLSDNFEEQIKALVLEETVSVKMTTKFGERGDQVTYDVGNMYEELKNSLMDANWAPTYQPTVIKKAEQPVKAKGTKKSTKHTSESNNNNWESTYGSLLNPTGPLNTINLESTPQVQIPVTPGPAELFLQPFETDQITNIDYRSLLELSQSLERSSAMSLDPIPEAQIPGADWFAANLSLEPLTGDQIDCSGLPQLDNLEQEENLQDPNLQMEDFEEWFDSTTSPKN